MHTYRLRLDQRFQVMDHFGASGAWSIDPIGKMWSLEGRQRLADLLFSRERGIGLSAWRFSIGAGGADGESAYPADPRRWRGHTDTFRRDEHSPYDWQSHAGQRWFMQAAKERGVEQVVAFVYSPPKWLTKNGNISPDPTVGRSNLAPEDTGRFASYLADIVQHFAEEGMPFHAISPVNEPSWSWDGKLQEGNRYPNELIKELVKRLCGELDRRGLETAVDIAEAAQIATLMDDEDILAWDPNFDFQRADENGKYGGKYREYVKEFLGDQAFSEMIGHKLSYHAYWADQIGDADRLISYRRHLRRTLDRHAPNAKLWQTEFCNLNADGKHRDLGMDLALFTARVIHCDLTVACASAWNWWLAVSPHDFKDGLIYTDFAREGDEESVIPSKTLWTLGHYSRFIRPGAVRVGLDGTDDPQSLMASAYWHPADQSLTIVMINYGVREEAVMLEGGPGLPAAMAGYITSDRAGDDLRYYGPVLLDSIHVIPARSIVTLHGRANVRQ